MRDDKKMNKKLKNTISIDKVFYKKLITIALPIAIQNLISSSLNMIDTIMIGQLGETEIAAVGLANEVFFLLSLFLFGVCSGSAIFFAQFWGKRDIANIKRALGLCLVCSVGISLIFTTIASLIPEKVLSIFTKDQKVIELGSQYLRIVCISYIMTAITFSYAFALRNTGQPKVPMFVSGCAVLINSVLNYILIFGKLNIPKLGVRGAAIATVIARIAEMVIILLIVYLNQYPIKAKLSEMLDISKNFLNRFFNTTTPVIFNEMLWSLGVSAYSMVYARMGTGVIAAVNIASTIERMAMVLFIGMGHACAFIVGEEIGAQNEERAYYYGKKIVTLGPLVGIIVGSLLITFSEKIISIYRVSQFVHSAAKSVLIACAIIMPVRVFNYINIIGILRSGGDTKYSLFLDACGVWLMGVPMAIIMGLILKLPISYVYFLTIAAEQIFKFIFGTRRFVARKWLNNLVEGI